MSKVEFAGGGSLKSADFDAASGVLAVEFASGETRRYGAVTAEEFAEFSASDKPAKWFSDRVRSRPRVHPEVRDEAPAESPPPAAPALSPSEETAAPPVSAGSPGVDEAGVPMSVRLLVAQANRRADGVE